LERIIADVISTERRQERQRNLKQIKQKRDFSVASSFGMMMKNIN